jgi:hypothetical protein
MLTLITNLLLIPLLLTDVLLQPHHWINYVYLSLLTIVIFKEYFRRMDYANILDRYRLVIAINLACIIGLNICLFVSFK